MVGQSIGHYKILEKLGAGGMGEVYRAEDEVLGREVAIKVLPEAFTDDPERLIRFEREAKVLASLNHPHIAQIHGLEEAEGQRFLILELVEGETLAETVARGPIPLAVALPLSIQIAEALEAAHEKGVVHRDLKPANVKITPDGEVKVLDFGLAKPTKAVLSGDLRESPTLTYAPTGVGVLLGTAAYMSPEQVRGQEVDKRTDIWAFGVVLWEMLTGKKLFEGDTVTDVLASTLLREPDWERLPRGLPFGVRRVLRHCLVHDPKARLHDIADARIELEEASAEPKIEEEAPVVPTPLWRRVLLGLAVLLALVAGWFLRPEPAPQPSPTIRLEVPLPEGERLLHRYQHGLAMSPDGQFLAFVSGTPSRTLSIFSPETTQIYLRPLDSWQARPVPGTESSLLPIFSPDSEWLAFVSITPEFEFLLRKTPVAGGEVSTISAVEWVFGASWGVNDTIVVGTREDGLQQVSAAGGDPETLTELDREAGDRSHRLPHFLPGGDAVLYTAVRSWEQDDSAVLVHSLSARTSQLLVEDATDARYVESGHLVFARRGQLFAVPFDPEQLEVLGTEIPVLDGVSHSIWVGGEAWDTGAAQFSTSGSGILALARGSVAPERKRPLMLVDRNGYETQLEIEEKQYVFARMSPDGTAVLLSTNYPPNEVWLLDLERGTLTRQTFGGYAGLAIWGPDHGEFTYESECEGEMCVYIKSVGSGPKEGEELTASRWMIPSSWSPDGEHLAVVRMWQDIWIISRNGEAEAWLQTEYRERYPEFSPDGRWILYVSNESGRDEVYVRSFPGPGPAIQISAAGGSSPSWSRDGREIFFRSLQGNKFYSVRIRQDGGTLLPGRPIELFDGLYSSTRAVRQGDVTPDGRLLLIPNPSEDVITATLDALMPSRISVVENWFEELEQKVPTDQ